MYKKAIDWGMDLEGRDDGFPSVDADAPGMRGMLSV